MFMLIYIIGYINLYNWFLMEGINLSHNKRQMLWNFLYNEQVS